MELYSSGWLKALPTNILQFQKRLAMIKYIIL